MPPKPLETGDPRTLGRFELLARLGEGGQGIVYLGRGTGPGEERVAVKVLRSSVDASVLQRLAREGSSTATSSRPTSCSGPTVLGWSTSASPA